MSPEAAGPPRQGEERAGLDIHTLYRPFLLRFRRQRMARFHQWFKPTPETRVLDLGGTLFNWTLAPVRPRLTLVNLEPRPSDLPDDVDYIQSDARNLDLPDRSFDIVYSNSVIEHLGTFEAQRAMAREVARIGRGYFVQTPNRYFPVEPHLLTPLVHYLPNPVRRRLLRNFTVWGILTRPDAEACADFVDEVRLIRPREMRALFPDATLRRERFAGLTKSLLAVRPIP